MQKGSIALLLWLLVSAPAQSRPAVDLRVAPPEVIQQLTLTDGSRLYGGVESIDGAAVVFRTVGGTTMNVTAGDIKNLRVARGRVVDNEFQPSDSHDTRLFFSPTGRSLPRGEGYVGVYEVIMPFVQVGLTDRISIGGGTPLIFTGDNTHPFWLTPKIQIVNHERAQVAAGIIHVSLVTEDGPDGGIAYTVASMGPSDRSATIGFGYAYADGEHTPILMIGAEKRTGRRIKLMTENWFWPNSDVHGFVSGGIRFLGERLSADLALIVPVTEEDFFAFPLVSFASRFWVHA